MTRDAQRPGKTLRRVFRNADAVLALIALGKLFLHLLTATGYGYVVDELYTIAMGRHPAFGYVDIPPLVPWLSALSGSVFGYSLFAIHLLPAVAGAATVFLSGLIARRLGGGVFAQALTALIAALGPMWLLFNSWFAYDGFDQFATAAFLYIVLGILREENPSLRRWLVFGVAAGLGLMTKGSMLFYGFAFLAGLLLTPRRAYFARAGIWIGGAVAFGIFSPYLLWQWRHGWPVIEYWAMYGRFRTYHTAPLEFLAMQVVTMNPLTLPIWASGLAAFFRKTGRDIRTVGWMFIVLFVLCTALATKFYMMTACFFPLLAAGAVQAERFTEKASRKWLRPAYTGVYAVVALSTVPMVLPVLPAGALVEYMKPTEFLTGSVKTDGLETRELPEYLAFRFGWENLVKTTASVYRALSHEEQAECTVLTGTYGSAGAIDLFGPRYGLPPAVCGHLSYYLWGPGERSGKILIAVHIPPERLSRLYEDVRREAVIVSPYAMPSNTNLPVYVCRRPRFSSFKEIWPEFKAFD